MNIKDTILRMVSGEDPADWDLVVRRYEQVETERDAFHADAVKACEQRDQARAEVESAQSQVDLIRADLWARVEEAERERARRKKAKRKAESWREYGVTKYEQVQEYHGVILSIWRGLGPDREYGTFGLDPEAVRTEVFAALAEVERLRVEVTYQTNTSNARAVAATRWQQRCEKSEAEVERWTDKATEALGSYANANAKHHEELSRANRLRDALSDIVNALGPVTVCDCDQCRMSEGLRSEAIDALTTAKAALAREDTP